MAKTNRDDGSFATSDLFTPHPTIAGAYRYVTRADSTLVLTNGKKFDPIPLEEAVRRIRYVDEAIVIGQNRDRPGILVFCLPDRMSGMDYAAVVGEVRNALLQATPVSWSHASIDPGMVIIYTDGRTWPKSSKGTAIRKLAEEWFVDDINDAYKRFDSNSCVREWEKIPRNDTAAVAIAVARIIGDVTGCEISGSEDLYLRGVDSIMAMGIRKRLLDEISVSSDELPSNVVYEQRTIEG